MIVLGLKQWKNKMKEVSIDVFLYAVNLIMLLSGYRMVCYAMSIRHGNWTDLKYAQGDERRNEHLMLQMQNATWILIGIGILLCIGVIILLYLIIKNIQNRKIQQIAQCTAMGYTSVKLYQMYIVEEEIKAALAFMIAGICSSLIWKIFTSTSYIRMMDAQWITVEQSASVIYFMVFLMFMILMAVYIIVAIGTTLDGNIAGMLREE